LFLNAARGIVCAFAQGQAPRIRTVFRRNRSKRARPQQDSLWRCGSLADQHPRGALSHAPNTPRTLTSVGHDVKLLHRE